MGKVSAIFGTHDEKTLAQLRDVAERAERPRSWRTGTWLRHAPSAASAAYDNKASVVGVGFDIAAATRRFDKPQSRASSTRELERFADEIQRSISFGIGRRNDRTTRRRTTLCSTRRSGTRCASRRGSTSTTNCSRRTRATGDGGKRQSFM